jgi:hypothetical protein
VRQHGAVALERPHLFLRLSRNGSLALPWLLRVLCALLSSAARCRPFSLRSSQARDLAKKCASQGQWRTRLSGRRRLPGRGPERSFASLPELPYLPSGRSPGASRGPWRQIRVSSSWSVVLRSYYTPLGKSRPPLRLPAYLPSACRSLGKQLPQLPGNLFPGVPLFEPGRPTGLFLRPDSTEAFARSARCLHQRAPIQSG